MNYYTTSSSVDTGALALLGGFLIVIVLISLAIAVISIIGMWKMFTKAGEEGWKSIIPIYNIVVFFKVIHLDWWHILIMLFVPFASVVYGILMPYKLAKVFGKGTGFAILTVLFEPIMLPILAFGSAQYEGQ
jgi:hypothetical protein